MHPSTPTPSSRAELFPPVTPAAPFSADELRAALRHPAAAIDVLLAQRARWTASVVENRNWGLMLGLILLWGVVFSLPYGLVLSFRQAWQIAALFLGSVAICLPSLHVVSAYLGLRVHFAQSIAFASIVATVAAIFSFGFAPILWFLKATTDDAAARDTLSTLSSMLLGLAAFAGAVHGARCLGAAKHLDEGPGYTLVVLIWQVLLFFIGVRMSDALGLQ